MSEKYNEYCMKFSNEELKRIFDKMKHEEVFAEIICLAGDGSRIDFDSDSKIETIAFDEEENIAIMFRGFQTSIFAYDKEIMFIDENSKGTYTLSDVFGNVVYEGKMREMSHEQMLRMFVKIVSCFIDASSVQVTQLEISETSGYQKYNYYEPHQFVIDVENGHADRKSWTFENITINY